MLPYQATLTGRTILISGTLDCMVLKLTSCQHVSMQDILFVIRNHVMISNDIRARSFISSP